MFAQGKDVLAMKAIVGEVLLTEDDKKHIKFLTRFENNFLPQAQYKRGTSSSRLGSQETRPGHTH
jgi:V-type H+-transporting ATPase subunit B